MGIKERREREKQVTRENILLAARRIAREEGWPALTIRKVAESIEYSPPMVYEYFASKDEILLELMREGFRQLMAAMQQAAATAHDSEQRLFAIVDAYWSFARNNMELYQVMNGMGGVALDSQATVQAGRESQSASTPGSGGMGAGQRDRPGRSIRVDRDGLEPAARRGQSDNGRTYRG